MRHHTLQLTYFFGLFLIFAAVSLLIFLPYLPALFFAVVLAVVFWPVHRWFDRRISNRFISAFGSTLVVLAVIVMPLILFAFLLFQQLSEITAANGDILNIEQWLEALAVSLESISPSVAGFVRDQAEVIGQANFLHSALQWLFQNLQSFFAQFVHVVVSLALSILALFYLFKDGNNAITYIKRVSPLPPEHDEKLMNKIKAAVDSVIGGRLLTSLIQGVLAGVAFAVVGVQAPVLWGAVAGVISVVPMLGPGLVVTPAIIYLVLVGNIWGAVVLLIWAFIAIYFIDDILQPIFIHQGMQIHPLLILFAILGGLSVAGPVGFVAGPVVISLFFALLDLYPVVLGDRNAEAGGL